MQKNCLLELDSDLIKEEGLIKSTFFRMDPITVGKRAFLYTFDSYGKLIETQTTAVSKIEIMSDVLILVHTQNSVYAVIKQRITY